MGKILIATSRANRAAVIKLLTISCHTDSMFEQRTDALGVDHSFVALADEIEETWIRLPCLILRIPPALRDEKIVNVCIAIESELLDAAINYVWISRIVELRQKVRRFARHAVEQVIADKSFDVSCTEAAPHGAETGKV